MYMKKIITLCFFAVLQLSFVLHKTVLVSHVEPLPSESAWVKSQVGIWLGNYNVWYKIDKKSGAIKISYNKKKWKETSGIATWQDYKGRWLYIFEHQLMCSENGTQWKEIPNKTWQDIHGTWYRFDSQWDLWEVNL